jgi:MFS family permease
LTKSNTSLVWIAGPLSGLIVQPIVGVIADEYKSRWGRRRPFIMVGAVLSAVSLLILGFTKEIVALFVSDEDTAKTFTIVLAVLAIYAVDFAVNAGVPPNPWIYGGLNQFINLVASHVCCKEFDCRYAPNIEATDRICLGCVHLGFHFRAVHLTTVHRR